MFYAIFQCGIKYPLTIFAYLKSGWKTLPTFIFKNHTNLFSLFEYFIIRARKRETFFYGNHFDIFFPQENLG